MEENVVVNTPPQKKGMNYSVYVVIVIFILVIVIGGMYIYKKNSQQAVAPAAMQPTQAMMAETPTTAAMQAASGSGTPTIASSAAKDMTAQKFNVTASNFTFMPKKLTVKKGQPVTINFTSGNGTHDFVIDELQVKSKMVSSGQEDTITFTPTKTGTFDYYCSVGNHRAMGMQGTITVE